MIMYRIELTPDDNDTFLVTSPAFPEVTTFGDNREDAIRHGRDAIDEAIAGRIADGEDIPPPDFEAPHRVMVHLHLQTELKVTLYLALKAAGITRAELMRRLGWKRESVDRLFRLDHSSRLGQMEAAFQALGIEVGVEVRDFA